MAKRSRPEHREHSQGPVLQQVQSDPADDHTRKRHQMTCRTPLSRVPSNPTICNCSPICTSPSSCKQITQPDAGMPGRPAAAIQQPAFRAGASLDPQAKSCPVTDAGILSPDGLPHSPASLIELRPNLKSFLSAANDVKAGNTPFVMESSSRGSSCALGGCQWLDTHVWLALAKSMKTECMHPPVGSSFMKNQVNINSSMRTILIDWLLEVVLETPIRAVPSGRTLQLAVQILDRYLSAMEAPIARSRFQLAGITALMIANKYDGEEEWYFPTTGAVYLCDGACTAKEVCAMEREMFATLGYFVGYSVPADFLEYYILASGVLSKVAPHRRLQFGPLCQLYCDVALLDMNVQTNFSPSAIAATAVLLAQRKLGVQQWSPTAAGLSGYTEDDLQKCAASLDPLAAADNLSTTIMAKYTALAYFNVMDLL